MKQVNEHTQTARYFSLNGGGSAVSAGAAAPAPAAASVTTHRRSHHKHKVISSAAGAGSNDNYAKGIWHFYDTAKKQEVYCSKDIGDKFTNLKVGQTVS